MVVNEDDLPSSPIERAAVLENLMIARATGNMSASTRVYECLRRGFMGESATKNLLPAFVCTCRGLDNYMRLYDFRAGADLAVASVQRPHSVICYSANPAPCPGLLSCPSRIAQ